MELNDLKERVEVSEYIKLQNLVSLYAKARDTTDISIYKKVFIDDARIEMANGLVLSNGLNAILKKVSSDLERFNKDHNLENPYSCLRHSISNMHITIDGTSATCEYYVMTIAYNTEKNRPEILSFARNTDTCIKENGKWLIAISKMAYDWGNEDMAKLLQIGPYTPEAYKHS